MAIKNSVAKVMRYLKKNGLGNTVYALVERVFFAYNKNYTYQEPDKAILKLVTLGGLGIWWIVDWFQIQDLTMKSNMKKFNENLLLIK